MPLVPASIRNRNPGAMEPGPSSKKFGSTSYETLRWTYKGKPATNRIATFATSQHGAAAMFDLLERRYTGLTIEKAISKWCGGYYASAYASALQARGVNKTTVLTAELVKDHAFAIPLCKGMAKIEAGQEYPLTDEHWAEAHSMAFGGAVAPEFAPDNDVPSPGPVARTTAALKDAAPKVAGGIAAGGAIVAPAVPTPPDLTPVTAWQMFGEQVAGLGSWAVSRPILTGALVLFVGALAIGPWIARRFA